MTSLEELSAEIRRIVFCPYTPSLKKLQEIAQNADLSIIQGWARINVSQIDPLAAAVLEGVELWPFKLDLLRRLAWIPTFRDAVMQQKPVLLHTLLAKATESTSGFEKYATTCAALLATPLKVVVPSNTLDFLEKSLEKAVDSMSPESIKSIYWTLSGLGSSYLEELSIDVVGRLQIQIIDLLSKLNVNDLSASLSCLAVLAKIASKVSKSPPNSTSISSAKASSAETGNIFTPARRFFCDKKAPKSLQMAVLNVINVCSANSSLGLSEALDIMTLSEEIINAIGSHDKKSWVTNNLPKIRNLYGKMLRKDIDTTLQYAALNVVGTLLYGEKLPEELKPIYERVAFATNSLAELGQVSPRIMQMCFISLDPTHVSRSLIANLRLACADETPNSDGLVRIDGTLPIVDALITVVSQSNDLCHALLEDLTRDGCALLQNFANQRPSRLSLLQDHSTSDVCPSAYFRAIDCLHQRLGVMLVSIGLHSSQCDQTVQKLLVTLFDKQTELSNELFHCRECIPIDNRLDQATISLFEAGNTPETHSVSHNWRESIAHNMSRDMRRQHESITRSIGAICRDLELRCDEAERPLREEQCRSRELLARFEESHTKLVELESLVQTQKSELNDMRSERDDLSTHLKASGERLQDLSTTFQERRQESAQVKRDAENEAQAAMEESRQKDLNHLATIARKDMILEDRDLKCAALQGRVEEFERQLAQQEAQISKDAEIIAESGTLIQDLKLEVTKAREQETSMQTNIDFLTKVEIDLKSSREKIVKEADEALRRHEYLVSNLNLQLQIADAKAKEMRQKHEYLASQKNSEITDLKSHHQIECDRLETNLREARSKAATTEQAYSSQLLTLQKKIKRLKKDRDEQAKEVAEARAMQHGLMAFMGNMKNQPNLVQNSLHTASPTSGTLSLEKRDPDADATTPLESNSSIGNGPTPKRTRIHRISHSYIDQTSKDAVPVINSKSAKRSTIKPLRTPLADLALQYLPQKSCPMTPTQRIYRDKSQNYQDPAGEHLQGNDQDQSWHSDDESFDGGDIFTSTDQRQLSILRGNQVELPRNRSDETTADF